MSAGPARALLTVAALWVLGPGCAGPGGPTIFVAPDGAVTIGDGSGPPPPGPDVTGDPAAPPGPDDSDGGLVPDLAEADDAAFPEADGASPPPPPPPPDMATPDATPPPPPPPGCTPACDGRGCGDDGCGGSCGSCPAAQSCSALRECRCETPVELVVWNAAAWNVLADALAANPSPCAHHYLSVPPVADTDGNKTLPRAGQAEIMHARGPRFHALAEFHFTSWARRTDLSWYERGVEFRRRMAERGYDVTANDGWALNEFPSSVRSDPTTRRNLRDLVRGLYDGPSGAPKSRGAIFVINLGHVTSNLGVYKGNLENWLSDADFWVEMNTAVRFFAQEVYVDPVRTCVPGTTVAARSQRINDFAQHLARLASVGPDAANTAQSYLGRSFVPLLNAVWNKEPASGYGDTTIPLEQMKHHVSGQVHATRAWASSHPFPDGRIGFAWDRADGVTDAQLDELAARLASALHGAYDADGGSAARACSPSGAYTFCQCSIAGATFNDAWQTFSSW